MTDAPSGGSAIKVIVRVRPASKKEIHDAERCGREFQGTVQVGDNEDEVVVSLKKLDVLSPTFAKGSDTVVRCQFTKVLRPEADQDDVFDVFHNDIEAVLRGANVTIFAYGQTGTGKTHTMVGFRDGIVGSGYRRNAQAFAHQDNRHRWGIIPRSIQLLFDLTGSSRAGGSSPSDTDAASPPIFLLSYIQIYNGKVYDLLASGGAKARALPLRMHARDGAFVEGLSKHELTSLPQALDLFDFGEAHRRVRSTQSNMASSRSHVILQVQVLSLNHGDGGGSFSSRLTLVDLAGSEKWAKSLSSPSRKKSTAGAHLREMNAINSSLSALGNCIRALAKNNPHIPYRDSTLTKLLRHAFNPPSTGACIRTWPLMPMSAVCITLCAPFLLFV